MPEHIYSKTCRTAVPLEALFSWHERAGALERLTPPWMTLRNIKKKGGIETGARVSMEMKPAASPIPIFMPMAAEHVGYEKNRFFMDMLVNGPFSEWEHTHLFSRGLTGGGQLEDRVRYALPFHLPKPWRPRVEKELNRLFTYRHRVMCEDLARHCQFHDTAQDNAIFYDKTEALPIHGANCGDAKKMGIGSEASVPHETSACPTGGRKETPLTIVISGASGPVGQALIPFLTTGGHRAIQLVRRAPQNNDEIEWNPYKGELDLTLSPSFRGYPLNSSEQGTMGAAQDRPQKIDVVINLNGYHIGSGRWTKKTREIIIESRNRSTELLSEKIIALPPKLRPELFISASATGFYGECGADCVDENSCSGDLFISKVCEDWEACAKGVEDAGIRTVFARMGVVLTPAGGALERLLPLFLMGLGAKIGSGEQYMSWISMDDLVYALYHIMGNQKISGAVNLVSPNPVTNLEFTQTLGQVLSRPTPFTIPSALIRLIWGKMGEEVLLASTRVHPDQLDESNFRFSYPTLDEALRHVLGRTDEGTID